MAKPANVPVWNTGAANRSTPSAGKQTLGWEPNEDPSSSLFNYNAFWAGEWHTWCDASTGEDLDDYGRGIYGLGNTGNQVVSTPVTLTGPVFYNNLTITSTGSMDCAGFPVYVRGVCTIEAGGVMHRNGNDGEDAPSSPTAGAGGAALPAGLLGGSAQGGAGSNSGAGAGNTGSSAADSLGGDAGDGGVGGAAGGSGGTAIAPAADDGTWRHASSHPGLAIGPSGVTQLRGGAGGGGGAEGGGRSGGGGGSGGGVVVLYAFDLVLDGAIQANGGAGGSASAGGPSSGAGGPGGGGAVLVVYRRRTGSGTITASAGAAAAHGNPAGTAEDGTVLELTA